MATIKTHMASDETLARCAVALERLVGADMGMRYNAQTGEYENIGLWLRSQRDGKKYSVRVPMTASTACTKLDANAGIAAPTPGTNAKPAVDPYSTLPAFTHIDVCGYPDADGRPHVTSIEWDGLFRRDGSAGNVCVMAPVLYWSYDVDDGGQYATLSISDSPLPGLKPQPEAYLPDGTLREYMLYPKYPLATYGGKPASASGLQPRTRDVSHNSLVTIVNQANGSDTSWTGKTLAIDWYVKTMCLMKYGTRDVQTVFAGCSSYDITKQPSAGTTSGSYVDVAKNHGFVQGSAIMVGTANTDRNNSTAHDVVDYAIIKSVASKDESSDRLTLDRTVTVTTAHYIKTALWPTGCCDMVVGDGSPTSPTGGKEPFTVQGIEIMHGAYEVFGNVVLKNSDGSGWGVYVNHDAMAETTSVSDVHEYTGVDLISGSADGWQYPVDMVNADGLLCGTTAGGSTTTGLCDGHYMNKTATTGERELRSFGSLWNGRIAGPFCLGGSDGLADAWWSIASRLSGTGRSRG